MGWGLGLWLCWSNDGWAPADCLPGGDNSVTPVHPATQRNLNPARLGTGLRKQVGVSQCGASRVKSLTGLLRPVSRGLLLSWRGGGRGGGGGGLQLNCVLYTSSAPCSAANAEMKVASNSCQRCPDITVTVYWALQNNYLNCLYFPYFC